MRSSLATATRALCGTLTALVLLELGLRAFVSTNPPPLPDIPHDALYTRSVTTREIDEGIGVARFSITGARLTGNVPIDNGETIVLLGDSFVAAREVSDVETTGSQLERIARAAGLSVNVRQYGWRGASPPQYLLVAKKVEARWSPAYVVVALSNDDLDDHVLAGQYPRMRVRRDGGVILVRAPQPRDSASWLVRHSVLAQLVRRRSEQIADRAPPTIRNLLGVRPGGWNARDPREVAAVPRAVVRALARAYGDGLAIVYIADVRVAGGEEVDPLERQLLAACNRYHVRCASTRDAMLDARRNGRIARGFSTTTLGVGHLNAEGHAIVARTIWSLLDERDDVRTASVGSGGTR